MWAGDFLADNYVDAMTAEQVGWYCLLLFRSWINTPQGYLPNNKQLLSKWCRFASPMTFEFEAKIVLDLFKETEDGKFIYHPKLVEQVGKFADVSEKRKVAGAKGGKVATQKAPVDNRANAVAIAKQLPTDSDSDSEPDSEVKREAAPSPAPPLFEEIREVPPDDFNELQCAFWFTEQIGQIFDTASMQVVADSFRLRARELKLPVNHVAIETLARAKLDQDNGVAINRFWFSDGKFKKRVQGNGNGTNRSVSKADELRELNRAALAASLRARYGDRGVSPDDRRSDEAAGAGRGDGRDVVSEPIVLPPRVH
jgi:uncharacterized protein YdaU (DUF1376 family)